MTWSPLACGILTGKYEDGIPCHSRAALKVNTTQRLNFFLEVALSQIRRSLSLAKYLSTPQHYSIRLRLYYLWFSALPVAEGEDTQ